MIPNYKETMMETIQNLVKTIGVVVVGLVVLQLANDWRNAPEDVRVTLVETVRNADGSCKYQAWQTKFNGIVTTKCRLGE